MAEISKGEEPQKLAHDIDDSVFLTRTEDATQLIISGFGLYLGKKEERLVIRKGKEVLFEFPFYRLSEVTLASRGISFSCDIIREFCERGIQLNLLRRSGSPYAKVVAPALSATVQTRREQFKALEDHRGISLCKEIMAGKIKNQRSLLLYFAKYLKQTDDDRYNSIKKAAFNLKGLLRDLEKLQGHSIQEVRQDLFGIEGSASRIYWGGVQNILSKRADFPGRVRRGATDGINSMLNYGYGILYALIWGAVISAGLEPFAGFLHVDRPGKPSLVLDLVEEFRQPIVDRTVIAHVNRGEPIEVQDGLLSVECRKTLSQKILQRLESKERYRGKMYQMRSIIQIQARNVAAHLRGDGPYRAFAFKW